MNVNLTSNGFKQGGLGAGVTNLDWDRWTAFNGNNPIVQTYWTAEHNIGNGSTNDDHYELGNYNADGSNLSTYPAVYRGILNFFGDILTFVRDVAIINRNTNYNSVYLLKKRVNHSDVTIDNIQDKCYFIGDQANTDGFITEFDFRFGPYFVPNKVGTNKKLTIIRKEVVMGKIQIKLFMCFCLAVALITVLRLALVSFILIGFGQVLLLMSASLLQLNLIK